MRLYPWLRSHFKQLIISYQARQGGHALLIQTLPGMGDQALVYSITRFLMCQRPEMYKNCGKCHACQLMQAGTHPDYYILWPEKDKNALSADSVRNINEKLYEYSYLGGSKVVWINNAALLTEAASNALLKTLEELPEKTWFFLSCYQPWRLLSTLRSRCRFYYLGAPREEWALGWLQREIAVSHNAALAALRLCSGAPAAALKLFQEKYWTQRAQLCSVLNNALESCNWLSLIAVLNHENFSMRLRWLITLLLDALKLQQGATTITNVDVEPLLNNLGTVLTSVALCAIIRALCQCREQLLTVTGLNCELILTDWLLIIEHYLQSRSGSDNCLSLKGILCI